MSYQAYLHRLEGGLRRSSSSRHDSDILPSSDDAVRATNDDAFASKVAALRKGYYRDPFLSAIASRVPVPSHDVTHFQRTPIINRGTFVRVLLKTALVKCFRRQNATSSVQIISLGAGFDTLPFQLVDDSGLYPSFHYVELDFDQVVKSKIDFVHNVPQVNNLFESVTKTPTGIFAKERSSQQSLKSCYSLHACDLRDLTAVQAVLEEAGIDFSRPTLFLAEIVLVYMDPTHSDSLIHFASQKFTGPKCFINMEHLQPTDAFGQQMCKNIAARGSPLLGIHKYPTLDKQKARFTAQGWTEVTPMTMLTAFTHMLNRSQTLNLNRIEVLDEVEQWGLIMGHYCLVIAVNGAVGEETNAHHLMQDILRSCLAQVLCGSVMSSPV